MSVLTTCEWPASFRLDHLAETTDELHGSWGGRSGPAWRNAQGGDVGCGGRRAMLRHTANYAMAPGRIQQLAPSPELDTAGVIARPTGTAVGTGLIAASVVDHDG